MLKQRMTRGSYRAIAVVLIISMVIHPAPVMAAPPDPGSPPAVPGGPGLQSAARSSTLVGQDVAPQAQSAFTGAISLQTGWNLLSIPLALASTDITQTLASIAGSYAEAFAYDASNTGHPWKHYTPAGQGGNSLTTLDRKAGFWLRMTAPATLHLTGAAVVSTTLQLYPGWNLVGYPLTRPQPVETALASIAGKYTRVIAFEQGDPSNPWKVHNLAAPLWANDLQVMIPGRGYWLFATAATPLVMTEPAVIDVLAPQVTISLSPTIANVGEPVLVTVGATDDTLVLERRLSMDGVPIPLNPAGQAVFRPDHAGLYTALGEATDGAGNLGRATAFLRARSAVDNGPPIVSLTAPSDGSAIETVATLTGAVADSDLVYYELQARAEDGVDFATFGRGFVAVPGGPLGTLDARLFVPGPYMVRVCAEDTWGNRACSDVYHYELLAPAPLPGVVRFGIVDGRVSAAGLPITAQRIYDSRNKTRGDFGIGWRISFEGVKLHASRPLGENWQQQFLAGNVYALAATAEHRLTVTMPDGTMQRFVMHPTPQTQPIVPIQYLSGAVFDRLGSTTATLTPDSQPAYVDPPATGSVLLLDSGFNVYNPASYHLTLRDGTILAFTRSGGPASLSYSLRSITDPNGNRLTIGLTGITHSSGASIGLTRDALGRITTLVDANGSTRTYAYDANGDLAQATDFDGNVTQYRYDAQHNLIQVVDARGHIPGTLIYDAAGRVVATVDAEGQRVEIQHDDIHGQGIVTDTLGRTTIFSYDARGNSTSVVNALGQQTSFTYDGADRPTSRTDALGQVTTWTYDAQGNRLSEEDALGHTTLWTYNGRGQVTKETDALGHVTSFVYDARGNLISQADPLGRTSTFQYDGRGLVTSQTDAQGNTTRYAYDSRGNRIGVSGPLGLNGAMTYDANGSMLSRSQGRTTPTGTVTETFSFQYSANGNLSRYTDPLGNTVQQAVDGTGRVTAVTDPLGNATSYAYSSTGLVEGVTFPGGDTQSATYDSERQMKTLANRDRISTEFGYDLAGQTVTIGGTGGGVLTRTLDAVGQIVTRTDPLGRLVGYEYDAAGRVVRSTSAAGASTSLTVDALGNTTSQTDALGRAITITYDAAGQPVTVTRPDGTQIITAYDALGRKTAVTDAAGRTTRYGYDALNRLVAITDTLGYVTAYQWDEIGNLVATTDANGLTTRMAYDGLGRRIQRTMPDGSSERWTYDLTTQSIAHTDFMGRVITETYDIQGRLVAVTYPDGSTVSYTYDDKGKVATVTDARGITRFTRGSHGRITQILNPDGSTLAYSYDLMGNITTLTTAAGTTTYAYDVENRLQKVTDASGGITTYAYDLLGRRTAMTYANGITTQYTYDSLDRLVDLTIRDSAGTVLASYAYTFDNRGNRTRMVEGTGRTVDYTYDAAYRLIGERTTDSLGHISAIDYAYDAVGNRLSKSQDGVVTTYTYDSRDRLLAAGGETFSYDQNGNVISRTVGGQTTAYIYDYDNRLIKVGLPNGANVSYSYDDAGYRVRRQDAAGVRNFVWDLNSALPRVAIETNGAGGVAASYVLGSELISEARGSTVAYYHYDGGQNARRLTDAGENVAAAYDYDAFGNLTGATGDVANDYRFAGEAIDDASGLYYLRARYYDPALGRFTTMDPFDGVTTDQSSLHKYLYTGNDPVNHVDPTGLYEGLVGTLSALNTYAMLVSNYVMPLVLTGMGAFGTIKVVDEWKNAGSADAFIIGVSGGASTGLPMMGWGISASLEAVWFPMSNQRQAQGSYGFGTSATLGIKIAGKDTPAVAYGGISFFATDLDTYIGPAWTLSITPVAGVITINRSWPGDDGRPPASGATMQVYPAVFGLQIGGGGGIAYRVEGDMDFFANMLRAEVMAEIGVAAQGVVKSVKGLNPFDGGSMNAARQQIAGAMQPAMCRLVPVAVPCPTPTPR